MARSNFVGGLSALVAVSLTVGGCAVKASDTKASSEEAPANAWGASSPASTSSPTTPAESAPPGVSASANAEPAKPMAGCALVCSVANKGRIPAAEEARLTQGLADVTQALHRCVEGRIPSMTLRFDSTAKLTGFGVDSERESSSADSCIDSVNQRMPAVSYQGPATMRCSERCTR